MDYNHEDDAKLANVADLRRDELLDVAKHVLASMVASPVYDGTHKEYATAAVDFAQALIQEVNNASR